MSGNPEWCVLEVTPHEDHTLDLLFQDGTRRKYDVRPLLKEKLWEPLSNVGLFMQAHVVGPTVSWTESIDIAPEVLYDDSVVVE